MTLCKSLSVFLLSCLAFLTAAEELDYKKYSLPLIKTETKITNSKMEFSYFKEVMPYVYSLYFISDLNTGFKTLNEEIKKEINTIVSNYKNNVFSLEKIVSLGMFNKKEIENTAFKLEFEEPIVKSSKNGEILSIMLYYDKVSSSFFPKREYVLKNFSKDGSTANLDDIFVSGNDIYEELKSLVKKRMLQEYWGNLSQEEANKRVKKIEISDWILDFKSGVLTLFFKEFNINLKFSIKEISPVREGILF